MMVRQKMRAVRFYAPGVLKLEDVDVPSVGPDELLIETRVALTCGTDVKTYRRGHPFAKPPLILGHEFAGVVAAAGANVARFRRGMSVVAVNSAPCNTCYYCTRGQPNLCENLEQGIIGFTISGAYAEYVKVPAHIVRQNTHEIPSHVAFEEAAILEPLSCVVHGTELAGIQGDDSVMILGSGPIGLLHLQLAKLRGAREVIMCDPHSNKLSLAKSLGADRTLNTSTDEPEPQVRQATEGRGADVVIEAAGRPAAWEMAVRLARKGGSVLFFGGCPSGTTVAFDTHKLHYHELTLKGSFHHTPSAVKKAMTLIEERRVKIPPLITKTMPLADVESALKAMATGDALKIAIATQR